MSFFYLLQTNFYTKENLKSVPSPNTINILFKLYSEFDELSLYTFISRVFDSSPVIISVIS